MGRSLRCLLQVFAFHALAIASAIRAFVLQYRLGRVAIGDSGIITTRDPDFVRGADVAYYSYARLPIDQTPVLYPNVAPELVVEVRSPSQSLREMASKASEYLNAGVDVVIVVDPVSEMMAVYSQTELPRRCSFDEERTLGEILPGFSIKLREWLN
jgi:Uma2 family endonuclease